jgi:deoxyribonuclease I
MHFLRACAIILVSAGWISAVQAADLPKLSPIQGAHIASWRAATRMVEQVYSGHKKTLYCGCRYSGKKVSLTSCGYKPSGSYANRSRTIEYEHIVPASLMAGHLPCWRKGGRKFCETKDKEGQARIFDPHNLAPEVGEINALRSNDLYRDLPSNTSDFGKCPIEDTRSAFEPPDCAKGDLARVWFYVGERYGLKLKSSQWKMFEQWSAMDPVSPWEAERERRVAHLTGVPNHFVRELPVSNRGSCPWD